MVFMEDLVGRGMDVVGRIARTALVPWGGAAACVDAYETAIRAVADAQLNAARVVSVEPARSVLATCAHVTRDIGAVHLSSVRWVLDV